MKVMKAREVGADHIGRAIQVGDYVGVLIGVHQCESISKGVRIKFLLLGFATPVECSTEKDVYIGNDLIGVGSS